MRILYTVETAGLDRSQHDEELDTLAEALHAEFPAFRVCESMKADRAAAVVVTDDERTVPLAAWERLSGWGTKELTLELVR